VNLFKLKLKTYLFTLTSSVKFFYRTRVRPTFSSFSTLLPSFIYIESLYSDDNDDDQFGLYASPTTTHTGAGSISKPGTTLDPESAVGAKGFDRKATEERVLFPQPTDGPGGESS